MADEEATIPTPPVEQEGTKEVANDDVEIANGDVEKQVTPEPQAESQLEPAESDAKEQEPPQEEPKEEANEEPKNEEEASGDEPAPKEEETDSPKVEEAEANSKEPEPASDEQPPKEDDTPQETPAGDPPKENGQEETAPAAENGQEAAAPKHPPRVTVRSSDPSVPVDLAYNDTAIGSMEPLTVGALFKRTKERFPDNPALAYEEEGKEGWQKISYSGYYKLAIRAAKSLLKLELEPLHGVTILGFNSVEWFISNMAAIFAGGLSVGIYATNSPEICQYIANDCQANIAVVENQKQLEKFLQVRKDLPHLKAIVQYKGKLSEPHQDVYDWEQFLALGDSLDNSIVEKKISQQKPEDCASLIYTSGTTGPPKGVMLSHDNLTWTVASMEMTYKIFVPGDERVVSYLPLSHIAAQIADMYYQLHIGGQTFFARPDALKGSLRDTLLDVQPTIFFGVPRVWEKLMAAIQAKAPTGGLKKVVASWAKGKGLKGTNNMQKGASKPFGWSVANKMVFSKVKAALGLQHCKLFSTSAAPISHEVLEYFMSLSIPLMELWGMSEATGPIISNLFIPGKWKLGSVGKIDPVLGVELKLHNKDQDGQGEVCFRGRNAMMGYLHKEDKTRETIDEEGWVHSGDLAKIDEEGYLFITGRIKELIITSGGENIAPVPIEERIKKEVQFLSNVMVVGDHRNYLTCLVTMKCVMDLDTGEPTDEIEAGAIELVAALGCSATKVSQIVDNQERAVFSAIQEGIDRANNAATSAAQTIKKWTLLDADFSETGGELGPTLKLKRFYVLNKYSDTIEALYAQTS